MADFANTAPHGRGICHVCGYEFNLKKDGTVRVHSDGSTRFPRMNCSGSGDRPRATVEPERGE